ncbi:MAG TPA: hypothetical protein VGG25_25925 [Streptosporangiaceae bacterium]|jgi:hypothetical protein
MRMTGVTGRRTVTGGSAGSGRGQLRRLAARGAVALALAAAALGAAGPAASAAGPAAVSGMLTSVAATSASNAWAVGYGGGGALTMHWTGTSWIQVPVPAPQYSSLTAVAAASATSAWAVGSTGSDQPLIEHWTGASWARVTVHLPSGSYLFGVAAVSARNAWIVGSSGKSKWRTLILHWNGTSWKRVTSPSPKAAKSSGDTLTAATAVSPGDAWATGWIASKSGNPARGLLLHWNGKTWRQVSAKAIPTRGGVLAAAAATSRASALAVGCDCAKDTGGGVIDRWNGRSWVRAHLPAHPAVSSVEAVTATSWRSAWAIGMYCTTKHCTADQAMRSMLLRWNGKTWTRTAAPLSAKDFLGGVAAVSASDAWAVGGSSAGGSLILHWNGSSWSPSS